MAAPWLRAFLTGLAVVPACAGLALAQESATDAAPAQTGTSADAVPRETFALLTLNQAELFDKSAWGMAAMAAAERAAAEVSAENRAIEAALEKEERALTEKRATTPAAEFSLLARDFDAKVEEFRQSQDAKVRAINRKLDEDRKTFVDLSVPLMAELLDEYGAIAIIGDDVLILSRSSADVTQRAIELMNERLPAPAADTEAEGQGDPAPGLAPDAATDAPPDVEPDPAQPAPQPAPAP